MASVKIAVANRNDGIAKSGSLMPVEVDARYNLGLYYLLSHVHRRPWSPRVAILLFLLLFGGAVAAVYALPRSNISPDDRAW